MALLEEFIFQLDQITRDCGLLLINSVLMIKACSRFNQVRSVASKSDFDFLSVSNQLSLWGLLLSNRDHAIILLWIPHIITALLEYLALIQLDKVIIGWWIIFFINAAILLVLLSVKSWSILHIMAFSSHGAILSALVFTWIKSTLTCLRLLILNFNLSQPLHWDQRTQVLVLALFLINAATTRVYTAAFICFVKLVLGFNTLWNQAQVDLNVI